MSRHGTRQPRPAGEVENTHPGYPLHFVGHPVLRQPTNPVGIRFADDPTTWATITRGMAATMRRYSGVGLAAPQVGMLARVCVVGQRVRRGEAAIGWDVLIDPAITDRDGLQDSHEGCLSLPGAVFDVQRAESIEVTYRDLDGVEHVEYATGYEATIVQHELDHLDGVLVDRRGIEAARAVRRNTLMEVNQ